MYRSLKAILIILVSSCGLNDTAPRPLVFYIIGDWGRNGSPNQQVVAYQMNERSKNDNPDFIVSTGDNFYDVGVASLKDKHWNESFEKVYSGENIKLKPWYISLGNHDYLGNTDIEIQYSSISPRWNLPATYYTKIFTVPGGGKVRMIFIDTSPFEKSYYNDANFRAKLLRQDSAKQKRWLDSLTSLSDVDWKIVVGHHHIYTGGVRKNDPNSVRNSLEPIFIKNKIDIYFCGHEHDLQYLKSPKGGTHYFLSGAGSDLRPTGKIPESIFSASINGFMVAEVTLKSTIIRLIDFKGNELFYKELTK